MGTSSEPTTTTNTGNEKPAAPRPLLSALLLLLAIAAIVFFVYRPERKERDRYDNIPVSAAPSANEAAHITKRAGEGDAESQYLLGVFHANGDGVAQDYAEAAKWFRKAADQGHSRAQRNMGLFSELGLGMDRDVPQAARWYLKAVEQHDAAAYIGVAGLLLMNRQSAFPEDFTWPQEYGNYRICGKSERWSSRAWTQLPHFSGTFTEETSFWKEYNLGERFFLNNRNIDRLLLDRAQNGDGLAMEQILTTCLADTKGHSPHHAKTRLAAAAYLGNERAQLTMAWLNRFSLASPRFTPEMKQSNVNHYFDGNPPRLDPRLREWVDARVDEPMFLYRDGLESLSDDELEEIAGSLAGIRDRKYMGAQYRVAKALLGRNTESETGAELRRVAGLNGNRMAWVEDILDRWSTSEADLNAVDARLDALFQSPDVQPMMHLVFQAYYIQPAPGVVERYRLRSEAGDGASSMVVGILTAVQARSSPPLFRDLAKGADWFMLAYEQDRPAGAYVLGLLNEERRMIAEKTQPPCEDAVIPVPERLLKKAGEGVEPKWHALAANSGFRPSVRYFVYNYECGFDRGRYWGEKVRPTPGWNITSYLDKETWPRESEQDKPVYAIPKKDEFPFMDTRGW